MMFNTATS